MIKVSETPIVGVYEATSGVRRDARGQFARLFCMDELRAAQAGRPIVQVNFSRTREVGAIRGLHYQCAPHAEGKWVRCMRGLVFDVAVDLRRNSPTFLAWHAVQLDAEQMNAVFVPEGCAHGFQVLAPDSELLYLHTAAYAPGSEGGVPFDDPRIAVRWPLATTMVSERDLSFTPLADTFEGLEI